MKQQTAVEWLDEHLNMLLPFVDQETADVYNRLIEQAKEKEKEQILKARMNGDEDYSLEKRKEFADQYYKETYGNQ